MKVQAKTEGTTERVHMNSGLPVMEGTNVEKLQGDARDYLNAIRAGQIGKIYQIRMINMDLTQQKKTLLISRFCKLKEENKVLA